MTHDNWFQTASGGIFPVEGFGPADIYINDIAHALALQCRFAGHCRVFFSVAQHSVLASRLVPENHALWALLHDAAEAYLLDIPAPFKRQLPDYKALEKKVMLAICDRYGLPVEAPIDVKLADLKMLATEKRDLLVTAPQAWASLEGIVPCHDRIIPLDWTDAKLLFLEAFYELKRRRGMP